MAGGLVARGNAYYCYCTPDELKAKREAAEQRGRRLEVRPHLPALTPDEIAARERERRPRAVRFRVPDGADAVRRSRARADRVRRREHRRLRHPALRRPADLSPLRRVRRCGDGDHACGAGRRSHLEHAEADAAVSGARRRRAAVRARAADPRARQEAAEQAPRRDVGDGVRAAGLSARGDGELPRAARLVARQRRSGAVHARRAGRARSTRRHQRRQRGLQPREARLVQPAAHHAARARGARAAAAAVVRGGAACGSDAYLGERHAWFFAVLELLKPRAKRLDEFVALGRFFFTDAIEYDAAAVEKHLRADGMAGISRRSTTRSTRSTRSIRVARAVAARRGDRARA